MSPIQSLQHMLNHLARTVPTLLRLAETGIFDERTLEAVMIFQRDFGLPVTGVVDQITWDAIRTAYYQNLMQFGPPSPLSAFPSGTYTVSEHGRSPEIVLVQAMFNELRNVFSNFEQSLSDGFNSGATNRNLRQIQALSGLPVNGILDRATWEFLSALYRTHITRRSLPSTLLSV